ncbi:hypothetical protein PFTANZ_06248 [Plasmodium falciparum Tanzania (2000708)]|uniref:Duffy-binding-like domain-containing protein n=1 Tax=Plasmodium falciparum Tanzania (2000708) TaxID=1036725 RepID=A0A024VYP0_PLAFA|nr:hypothetical protein PFTANZ_06248 [Plasmodium falciparum Tanzania (2000708)]
MVTGSGGTNKSAKHVLDEFGQQVYEEKVKNGGAEKYIKELEAGVSFASILGEESNYTTDPCKLIKDKGHKILAARGERQPCGNESVSEKRFSKERVDEYDEKKIKDNKGKGCNNEGACAPYRRLSLCNKNFQKINNIDSDKARHNLLVDVCMAAKHEGDSIRDYYPQYDATYPGSGSTMCTMLARSFADIGDIVRGRDLYGGSKKEKEKLENNLKRIFQKIYDKLENKEAQDYYKKDDKDPEFFKLREDWWALNRKDVWKAMTCSDDDKKLAGAHYFRATCSDGGDNESPSMARDKCRCQKKNGKDDDNQVPTYFDYVPQFLRWFEEWAEDFCRKRKHKLKDVIEKCRGVYNKQPRYCSRNGYDCEQTIYKKGYFVIDKGCINCLYACNPYVDWIDKKKEEFDKQKKKYTDEINEASRSNGGGRQKRKARSISNDDNGYEKKFYEELKKNSEYRDVGKFLDILSKETACQGQPQDGEKISSINFINDEETFSHTEYCQPCPPCGVEKKSNGGSGGNTEWEKKKDDQCTSGNLYRPKNKDQGTPINFLYSGDRPEEIETKLKKFCAQTNRGTTNAASGGGSGDCGTNIDSSLCEPWKCYQFDQLEKVGGGEVDVKLKDAGGLCILQKTNGEEEVNKQKTFNNFFYYWVAHMLKDSIHWKKKLEKCLQNGTKTKCKNGCKGDCVCFQKWIDKKKNEWEKIVEHFNTQNIGNETDCDPIVTLEWALELEFANENIEEDKENNVSAEEAKEIKHLRDIIEKKREEEAAGGCGTGVAPAGKKKTLMDKLIEHEEGIAKKCIKKCEETQQPSAGEENLARAEAGPSLNPHSPDEENCKPCSLIGAKCKGNSHCKVHTEKECQNNKISADDIKNEGKFTEKIEMLVSDKSENGFQNGLQACKNAHIFKGIKENKYKCGKVCGYVVCKSEQGNGETVSWEKDNGKHIIQIRALFKRWVEYFFEDYKKITHKISHCIKNGENKCINGCDKKCTCVEQWIKLKKGEWDIVKKRFLDQYKNEDSDEYFNVRSCLETLIPQIAVTDVQNKIIKLSKFDNSCGCNYRAGKNGDNITETWECYYDENKGNMYGNGAINFCVLQNNETGTSQEKSMHYNSFFWKWVYHMLHDSLDWRNELGSCINNNTNDNTCKNNKCNRECGCFLQWVKKKETEWEDIKKHFYKQGGFDKEGDNSIPVGSRLGFTHDVVLEGVLDKDELLKNIEDTHADAKDIEHIRQMLEKEKKNQGTPGASGQKSTIVELLKHEEEIANKCKNCQPTKIRNPCSGESGNKLYPVLATKVAQHFHQEAQTQLGQNKSSLEGDISKAKFKNGASQSQLENICSITDNHTNDNRSNTKDGPCTGKGNGFTIGETWEDENSKSNTLGMHIRPRRKHMCTSNLEKLDYSWVINNANDHVNDTFLVDVLLAAKKEAEFIKKKYNEKKNDGKNGLKDDQVTTCRAIKSSFADLGDIIRGRDLWENGEAKQLQKDLVTIFRHIHSSLNGKGKYASDENKTPPYKQLREAWWEANRDQVWKAMTCPSTPPRGSNPPCSDKEPTPLVDYIPQGLRWMTEWAEWYCKAQSQAYGELLRDCGSCTTGKCNNDKCEKCTPACEAYKDKIKKWKDQWNKMDMKYKILQYSHNIT